MAVAGRRIGSFPPFAHLHLVGKIAPCYRGDNGNSGDWQEWPVDGHDSRESVLAESEAIDNRRAALCGALTVLNTRERHIYRAGRLAAKPIQIERLAEQFAISRGRVREIALRAFETVRNALRQPVADHGPPAALVMF